MTKTPETIEEITEKLKSIMKSKIIKSHKKIKKENNNGLQINE